MSLQRAKQLNVRDPEAAILASELAKIRGTSITQAVIGALSMAIRQEKTKGTLAERLEAIADDLEAIGRPGGRELTRDEIDSLWGNL